MTDTMRYGAVSAKARAMYGKRLTPEDFHHMSAMKSVPEVALFLRNHPAWGGALETADINTLPRERFEYLLKRHHLMTYLRLFHQVEIKEQILLRFPVLSAENEQIMRFMRLALDGRAEEYIFDLPPFFNRHSRIRYAALSSATTYDDMLKAVGDTGFHDALRAIRPDSGGFPPYMEVEMAMRRYYFGALIRMAREKTGETGRLVRESIGIQADWFNMGLLERLILYYPQLLPRAALYLIPGPGRLKPAVLHRLAIQQDLPSFRKVLWEETPYGRFLQSKQELGLSLETLALI